MRLSCRHRPPVTALAAILLLATCRLGAADAAATASATATAGSQWLAALPGLGSGVSAGRETGATPAAADATLDPAAAGLPPQAPSAGGTSSPAPTPPPRPAPAPAAATGSAPGHPPAHPAPVPRAPWWQGWVVGLEGGAVPGIARVRTWGSHDGEANDDQSVHGRAGYELGLEATRLVASPSGRWTGLIGSDLFYVHRQGDTRSKMAEGDNGQGGEVQVERDLALKEEALGLRLFGGPTWRVRQVVIDVSPMLAFGLARTSGWSSLEYTDDPLDLYGPSRQANSGSNLGFEFQYGLSAGVSWHPPVRLPVVIALRAGWQAFISRTVVEFPDGSHQWERLDGHGLTIGAGVGYRL